MNNKDVSTHMNHTKTLRRDDGMTMISTLAGLVVAGIVLTALALFWINSNQNAKNVTDVSAQEAAGLRVLNSAAKDIGNADPVVYADGQTIVVDNKKSGGKNRVRFNIDASDSQNVKIVRTVNPSPPAGEYNHSTSFPASGEGVKSKVLAERAKTTEPLFTYFDRKGKQWTSADSLKAIARVDIKFKADAGNGYVELETKAAVRKALGDSGDPNTRASCSIEVTGSINTGNDPVLTWEGAPTGATSYRVLRSGALVTTIEHTGPGTHTYVDNDAAIGANVYTVEPVNADGVATTTCAPVVITKMIDPPVVAGDLIGGDAVMRLQWATISGATAYEVTYQQVNPATDALMGTATTHRIDEDTPQASGQWSWSTSDSVMYAEFAADPGTQWRFSVKAVASSGKSKPSNEFDLLNAPDRPEGVTATASTHSRNTVTVTKDNSTGFVARTFRGATENAASTVAAPLSTYTDTVNGGTVEMTTSVAPGATATWAHNLVNGTPGSENANQDNLGYWYGYEVRLTNVGPRVAEAGQTLTDQRDETLEGRAAPRATALQFPADPNATVRGTERAGVDNNDGSADGTNLITIRRDTGRAPVTLSVAKSRQSGAGWGDFTQTASENSLPTGWSKVDDCSGANSVCLYDGAQNPDRGDIKPGTRYFYKPYAQNATGQSPAFWSTAGSKYTAAYQRPEAPEMHRALNAFWGGADFKNPTLNTALDSNGKPRGNALSVDWSRLPADESSGGWPRSAPDYPQVNQREEFKFCTDTAADCRYIVSRNNLDDNTGFVQRAVVKAGSAAYSSRKIDDHATDWGTRDRYAVQACNAGGCSNRATEDVDTYPGPFTAAQDVSGDLDERGYEDFAVSYSGAGSGSLTWAPNSTGSIAMKTSFTVPDGKRVNVKVDQQKWIPEWNGFGWDANYETITNGGNTTRQFAAEPSSVYRMQHIASSRWNSNLTRDVSYTRGTPPPRAAFSVNSSLCYYTPENVLNTTKFGSRIDQAIIPHSPMLGGFGSNVEVSTLETRYSQGRYTGSDNTNGAAVRAAAAAAMPDTPAWTKTYSKMSNGRYQYTISTAAATDMFKDYGVYGRVQRYIRTNSDAVPGAYIMWAYRTRLSNRPAVPGGINYVRTVSPTSTHIDWRPSTGHGNAAWCWKPSTSADVVYRTDSGYKYTEANAFGTTGAAGSSGLQSVTQPGDARMPARVSGSGFSYQPPKVITPGSNYRRSVSGDLVFGGNEWYVNN